MFQDVICVFLLQAPSVAVSSRLRLVGISPKHAIPEILHYQNNGYPLVRTVLVLGQCIKLPANDG